MSIIESKEIFTFPPLAERQLSIGSDPPSPRTGILKSASSPNGKISSNPNWKSISENGNSVPTDNGYKKQVRHSIVSIDSTLDLSGITLPAPKRKRCQRRLSIYLHTHVVLIIVSSLAILDAVCVIGQLICDVLIMREKLDYFEKIDEDLTKELLLSLPCLNHTLHNKWNLHAILQVIQGKDIHNNHGSRATSALHTLLFLCNKTVNESLELTSTDSLDTTSHHRERRAIEPKVPGHEVDHGILYELTHTFHLGSLAILSLLLLETLLKVFAMGKKLKHHKLEIFDALVVVISWSLDVGLWEGIWAQPGTQAATVLSYLLPWRVIRVVNSFVLVIQEKEYVQLKIVKQRLRLSLKKSKEAYEKASSYRHEVKALAGLCRKLGASETEITACSPSGKAGRRGSVQSVLERAASLTFISTLSSMGSFPSLFDMGGSSSDEEEEERIQHEDLEQAASNYPTLRNAVSCSSFNSININMGLDNEDNDGYQNMAFEHENRKSKTSDKPEEENDVGNKPVVDKTDSNDSVPPEYEDVTGNNDKSTHL